MKLEMNKKRIVLILIMSLIFFIVIKYFVFQNILSLPQTKQEIPINQNRIVTETNNEKIMFSPIELTGGMGFGILEQGNHGLIQSQTPQDTLTLNITNADYESLNFILKIFYNFEEVEFQIQGEDQKRTEILLYLEGGYEAFIPIHLPETLDIDDSFSRLTVGAFWFPEYAVGNWSELSKNLFWNTGTIVNYEVNYGFDNPPTLSVTPFEIITESSFGGFAIHSNPAPPGDGSLWHFSTPHIVSSGEDFELTFFANSHPLGDYVIISMLDWHQVSMSGKPFLWITPEHNANNIGQYGTFTVTAPEESGFYEFVAILIPTPTLQTSQASHIPLEQVRFTIEVVED